MRQSIRDEVMKLTSRLAQRCLPRVAEQYAAQLARYARLDTACDAFNSFTGCRPDDDADVFDSLSQRRRGIADLLARANLDAFEQEKADGLFLAIPFFSWCSDKQPVLLVNRTNQAVTYIRRRLYAFASAGNGIDEYQTASSAFADGIAAGSVIQPGERLQVDDYSMSYDGDFISNRRIVLIIEGERAEWFVSVSKLAGFLCDEDLHGFHELKRTQSP